MEKSEERQGHKVRMVRNTSRAFEIIRALALAGGVLTIAVIAPVGGPALIRSVLDAYTKNKRIDRTRLRWDLKRLQKKELVDFRERSDGALILTLTKHGHKQALTYNLDTIQLKRAAAWDHVWRLVLFDIPHEQKRAREAFREKLNLLGFYPLQKSVFVTPYPCEKEIDFICSVFDIRDCVILMNVSRFEGQEKLRRYFDI